MSEELITSGIYISEPEAEYPDVGVVSRNFLDEDAIEPKMRYILGYHFDAHDKDMSWTDIDYTQLDGTGETEITITILGEGDDHDYTGTLKLVKTYICA